MAPVIPNPDHIEAFESQADFEAWLAEHHTTRKELWIKIHKKGSGLASITPEEAIKACLCWGWIDGMRKGFDQASFLQRYTPRGAKSIWSQVNVGHVARLTEAGRMQPSGLRHVEAAKADGRWQAAYAPGRDMQVPEDFLAALSANPAAAATFETLNRQNIFAIGFRLGNLRKAETRARKIGEYVDMLARGETLVPNGKARTK
jgi:uncharacterized protein YdeI (YjbR/CyaY-like superfamily)